MPEIEAMAYGSLHHPAGIPTITLDRYVDETGIVPNGFNIDVEGAELKVLRGAKALLQDEEMLGYVWVSIHPDLLEGFGNTKEELIDFMVSCGWLGQHLGTDHEEHWLFRRAF
jgi:hypothetical protein